jgi:glycosyltransferase involved in cell wall biosynthesis
LASSYARFKAFTSYSGTTIESQMGRKDFSVQGRVMNQKPRILLIPNVAWWIIGEIGKQIITRFGYKYDFYFLPESLLERRPDLLRALVSEVDAIHCLNESSIQLFRDFDQKALPPIVTWIHHVTVWSAEHQMALDRSSALTVCTRKWKDFLDERTADRIPVTIVPHGVDTKFFQRKKVHPKRFGIPENHFVLGFVGNKGSNLDNGRKGIDVLLNVIHEVAIKVPRLHVVLGGPGWESELRELRSFGISSSATGYIRNADLPAMYSAFDVYLLTSRVEGGPCTVFEAMACETAVVSTRVGAVPELIVDGVNGYSTNVDDCEALVSTILALEQFPANRIRIGKNGRKTVVRHAWASTLSPLENVYDKLVQQRCEMGLPQQEPFWIKDPQKLLRASCAADALLYVIPRVRKRLISPARGTRLLMDMMSRQSLFDLARGVAMIQA